jgi:hypothetical protein
MVQVMETRVLRTREDAVETSISKVADCQEDAETRQDNRIQLVTRSITTSAHYVESRRPPCGDQCCPKIQTRLFMFISLQLINSLNVKVNFSIQSHVALSLPWPHCPAGPYVHSVLVSVIQPFRAGHLPFQASPSYRATSLADGLAEDCGTAGSIGLLLSLSYLSCLMRLKEGLMEARLLSQLPATWQGEAHACKEVPNQGVVLWGGEKTSNLVAMAPSLIAVTGQGRHEEAKGEVRKSFDVQVDVQQS